MSSAQFQNSVFINCPFDEEHAPLLEAAIFCCVYAGLNPRLANARLEAGANRLDKIISMIKACRFSIHDLSRSKAIAAGETFRMNMPFEFGLDYGLRKSGQSVLASKKFLIFEHTRFDLKPALSDIGGQDPEFHDGSYELVIRKVRNFLQVEASLSMPGASLIKKQFETFQAWLIEKKIDDGHSEKEALNLPTRERMDAMQKWISLGKPLPHRTSKSS